MRYLVIFILALSFIGCTSIDKQHFKARQYYMENKDKLAELCAAEFPVIPEYIKGEEIVRYDTISYPYEVLADCPDGTKVECPKPKTIIKEVVRTDTVRRPDLAQEQKLRDRINKVNADNAILRAEKEKALEGLKQSESENKSKDWIIIGLIFTLGICVFVIIKK